MLFKLVSNSTPAQNLPAVTRHQTSGGLSLESGTKFQIRRLGPTENYADWEVPSGKKWAVTIDIVITEEDE